MTQEIRIPNERIAVIIGKQGQTRRYLEKQMNVSLKVDSDDGIVTITNADDPVSEIRSMDPIKAIGRGFSPQHALKLFDDEDNVLDVIDLSDDANTPQKLYRIRGRIIGKSGKSREQIENMTNTYISIFGKTVGIIGSPDHVANAREAILMLIGGSDHSTVFKFLDQKNKKAKLDVMNYYYSK
ncbi:MAG TPA: KH domain-containing protein [Methanocorpusculum sp.]|nr:KH domain-containing protein [Methanocorpusculum sp.]HJJ56049.1 KH domain-containing protein [Methanocorpusculum sp.]